MKSLNIIKKITLSIIAISILILGMNGCTGDFDEINSNKNKLSALGEKEAPFAFSKAQTESSMAFWKYQVAQNLFSDLYAQYFATCATYFPSDRNVIRMDWIRWIWIPTYTENVPQLKTILDNTDPASAENALANIMWVYTFHRITDHFGPIPYFKAGEGLDVTPYDAQDKIYADFFARLDSASKVLNSNKDKKPFGSFDLIYAGDVTKWIKFANSLRLRLAMRISNVDPAKAKTEAEAAIAGGVMESTADDALMYKTENGTDVNGLAGISVWNEFRMSAAMESTLKGYKDPRIGVYFQPTGSGEFEGLRNGLTPTQLGDVKNLPGANSNIGTRWVTGSGGAWNRVGTTPQNIMHAAEIYFIRAEGALKGWNVGGSAQVMYNKGIEASMKQWGINNQAAIDSYINSSDRPSAPGDFLNSGPLNDAPIKFDNDVNMQKLQIATQKWLALYPDGIEAWADSRRSNLPVLYPVANNENADITGGGRPLRIPFLDQEKVTHAEGVKTGEPLLGGPDKVSTPLWWDK